MRQFLIYKKQHGGTRIATPGSEPDTAHEADFSRTMLTYDTPNTPHDGCPATGGALPQHTRLLCSRLDSALFSTGYAEGRKRWLARLALLTGPLRYFPYQCSGVGPDNEALLTDTVWLGDDDAEQVLVVISGTHGVEGLAGNAIELDCLDLLISGAITLPERTAILLVHALTPWGYAWLRRCGADGVDLNRNAVDFSEPLPENPGYEALRPALMLGAPAERQAAFAEFQRQYGQTAFETAISAGQYHHPDGPFYGGQAPAHGRLVTEDLMQRYDLAQRDLTVVDLHTGLGSFGYGEIICDHEPDSAGTAVARKRFGKSVMLPALGTSSSVPKHGLMDYAWHPLMNSRSCYVTLEFGTYPTLQLFDVVLTDHLLWAQTGNEAARRGHRDLMREHFCPDDNAWREMVLFRSRQVILQALQRVSV